MAIHPIDLQTMFTQIDKVGKNQLQQDQQLQLQQGIAAQQFAKDVAQQKAAVQNTTVTAENQSKVGADDSAPFTGKNPEEKKEKKDEDSQDDSDDSLPFAKDPKLGNRLDVSL